METILTKEQTDIIVKSKQYIDTDLPNPIGSDLVLFEKFHKERLNDARNYGSQDGKLEKPTLTETYNPTETGIGNDYHAKFRQLISNELALLSQLKDDVYNNLIFKFKCSPVYNKIEAEVKRFDADTKILNDEIININNKVKKIEENFKIYFKITRRI